MNILAGVVSWLIAVALWLAAINEICKEVYPDEKPSPHLKALQARAKRRQQQQRDAEGPRRR